MAGMNAATLPLPRLHEAPASPYLQVLDCIGVRDLAAWRACLASSAFQPRTAAAAILEASTQGWVEGARSAAEIHPSAAIKIAANRPQHLVDLLARSEHPEEAILALAAVAPASSPETCDPTAAQVAKAVASLCLARDTGKTWRLLQEHCPPLAEVLAGVFCQPATRTAVLNALPTAWHQRLLSSLQPGLEFLAANMQWPPGTTGAMALPVVATGNTRRRDGWSSLSAWQSFLDADPKRRPAFVQDIQQPDILRRLLELLQMNRPQREQDAWVDWLAAILPRLPSPGHRSRCPRTLYPRLATLWSARQGCNRLATPLATAAKSRRRA